MSKGDFFEKRTRATPARLSEAGFSRRGGWLDSRTEGARMFFFRRFFLLFFDLRSRGGFGRETKKKKNESSLTPRTIPADRFLEHGLSLTSSVAQTRWSSRGGGGRAR